MWSSWYPWPSARSTAPDRYKGASSTSRNGPKTCNPYVRATAAANRLSGRLRGAGVMGSTGFGGWRRNRRSCHFPVRRTATLQFSTHVHKLVQAQKHLAKVEQGRFAGLGRASRCLPVFRVERALTVDKGRGILQLVRLWSAAERDPISRANRP